MKNLLKLLILVAVFSITKESFAQSFGVKAGLNLSNLIVKDENDTYSDEYKMNPGFHAGVTAEFPINELISFETGLQISTKGYKTGIKETYSEVTYEVNQKFNLIYLEIPLTAMASFNVGGTKIYGVFGPYIGMGISGKVKSEIKVTGMDTETDTETINWGTDADSDDLKRLDYGLTAGAGVNINSIRFGLIFSFGLANISSYTDYGSKIKNRVLGISMAYRFGGNKKADPQNSGSSVISGI
jgi:hypothetical protein